jgi:NADH-ubiquinone oxidoreductase chain 2
MLLLSILLFTAAMPFSTLLMSSLVIIRVAILVILLCSLLAFNSYFIEPLGVGVGIYGGLSLLSVISHGLTTLILASACLFMLVASGSLSHPHSGHLSNPLAPCYPISIRTPGAPLPELPLIILITTLGMTTLVTSSDLLTVYLSVELQTLPVYILACLNRESEAATSAGLKYFLIGALSSSFILLGSSLIYGLSGVTSLEGLYLLSSMGEGFTGLVIPEVIIGIALLIKLGAAPFHFWPPDVYDGVPTLVTTWVAIMPKLGILGFLALFQGFSLIRGDLVTGYTYWGLILVASALLSLVIAPLLALAQYRIKRLVAYSSISHMGFMLLALALQSPQALEAFLFYLIQYVVTSFNLFFVLIAFPFQLSSSSLRGILPAPALRLSFAVTLFSMAG